MWFHLIWICYTVIIYSVSGFVSKWANDQPNSHYWVVVLFGMGLFGAWPLVAWYSKNLILDALLYDLIIFLSFYITLLFLGVAQNFSMFQWIGTFFAAVGLILLKMGEYIK